MTDGLHPDARALLERAQALGGRPLEQSDPAEVRALRRAQIRPATVTVADVRDLSCGGVPCRLYRPRDGELGVLVYLHGGGWVIGDLDTHDDVARRLAAASGHAVLAVDYRLAPEHPFPAGLDDAFTAVRWLQGNAGALGCDADRIAIGGDSAGANLAAVVSQRSNVRFCLQVLVYPVTDARMETQSYRDLAKGPWLGRAAMEWFLGHYLSGGAGSAEDPRVSPLLADDSLVGASPPTIVLTASHDVLRDEGEAYAHRLAALGIDVSISRYEGVFHGFVTFADLLSDGAAALEECGAGIAHAFESSGERRVRG